MQHKKTTLTIGILIGIVTAASISANANRLSQFNVLAEEKGNRLGVNPNLIRAIVSVESAGRLDAVSPVGARGVMQLMPATAERMGIPRNQLFDPERNMEAGVRYLAFLGKRYNNNPTLMAAGYNAGEGAVDKYGGVPPYRETQNYAPAVVNRLNLLEQCGTACYTQKHMSHPQAYMNGNYAQQQATNQIPPQHNLNSWLGKPNTSTQALSGQANIPVSKLIKTVNVVATSPQPQTPLTTHLSQRKHTTGFVQTLQADGSYENLSNNPILK